MSSDGSSAKARAQHTSSTQVRAVADAIGCRTLSLILAQCPTSYRIVFLAVRCWIRCSACGSAVTEEESTRTCRSKGAKPDVGDSAAFANVPSELDHNQFFQFFSVAQTFI